MELMRTMIKKVFICCALLCTMIPIFAQQTKERIASVSDTDKNLELIEQKGWQISLGTGFQIGGFAPLPMPRSIRKIEEYNPFFNVGLEGNVCRSVSNDGRWLIGSGLRFESKGMKTKARVKNYYTEIIPDEGEKVRGNFTGHVTTKVRNTYLTIPVTMSYRIDKRWTVFAGPYFSLLLDGDFNGEAYDGYIRQGNPTGQYSEVTHAVYDFSDDLRRVAWGMEFGGSYRAYKHLAVQARLDWGMNDIFHSKFESVTFSLKPIYFNLGIQYIF